MITGNILLILLQANEFSKSLFAETKCYNNNSNGMSEKWPKLLQHAALYTLSIARDN